MKLYISTLFSIAFFSVSFGQDRIHESFEWDAPIQADSALSASESPYVVLEDDRYFEYDLLGSESLILYESRHKTVSTNTLEGIEYNNKLYIPLDDNAEIVKLMVRTILPNGDIIETKDDAIKDLKDLEGYKNLKILAINGVVLGSTVEYYYTVKNLDPPFWSSFQLQSSAPVQSSKVVLKYSGKLKFSARLVNDSTKLETMESKSGETTIGVELVNIPAYRKEIYSEETATKIRFDYTIVQLTGENATQPFDWTRASQRYAFYYANPEPKQDKKIAKLLKSSLKGKTDLKKKIAAIESYLKDGKNFNFDPEASEELEAILKNKTYSERGLIKLITHALMSQKIAFELVFTTDRFKRAFPSDYENWLYLEDVIIYIPALQEYLAPTSPSFRIGMIPPSYSANFGLFVPVVEHGTMSNNGDYRIQRIEPSRNRENFSNMEIDLDLSNLNTPRYNLVHQYGGLEALNIKVDLNELSSDERKRYEQFFAQMIAEDAELVSASFENYLPEIDPNETPFISNIAVNVPSLTEQAGPNTLLLKIGETIGPQVQMYQEEERITDAVIQYPHEYTRIITCKIPEGYDVEGLEALNMDINYTGNGRDASDSESFSDTGRKLMGFESSYTLEDGILTVKVYEFYGQVRYSKAIFEDFRKVINAAADFNKVTLILTKR